MCRWVLHLLTQTTTATYHTNYNCGISRQCGDLLVRALVSAVPSLLSSLFRWSTVKSSLTAALLLLLTALMVLYQDDQDMHKKANKVQEQLQGIINRIQFLVALV